MSNTSTLGHFVAPAALVPNHTGGFRVLDPTPNKRQIHVALLLCQGHLRAHATNSTPTPRCSHCIKAPENSKPVYSSEVHLTKQSIHIFDRIQQRMLLPTQLEEVFLYKNNSQEVIKPSTDFLEENLQLKITMCRSRS